MGGDPKRKDPSPMIDFLHNVVARLRHDDKGASLVEYALLISLIAVACIGALTFFGNGSGNSLNHSSDCVEAAYAGEVIPDDC
jgi:Flp pilus assembly pilin Flp